MVEPLADRWGGERNCRGADTIHLYMDRNYGGVFILWGRWSGTFQEGDDSEPVIFGTGLHRLAVRGVCGFGSYLMNVGEGLPTAAMVLGWPGLLTCSLLSVIGLYCCSGRFTRLASWVLRSARARRQAGPFHQHRPGERYERS